MIGSTISHYRIVAELGRGGMGIVYKAEDTKLNRTVALKVLPRQALEGEEEMSRFGREAQAAAALNHPHIATVYEIDEVEGQSFIVMEYVDGPNLQEKIDQGPLKLDEAIKLAIQVVDGLAAAHESGIVHRDVKPANIMLTRKGEAKIMDFGLAKLSGKTTLTKTGMTLGTAAYMSPEQGRGETVDYRSDIFSLGVVLYEMLTGSQAFKGEYAEAVVYSILNVDPDPITGVRSGIPMELERIVDKALAKNPEERYQHMDEMGVDLQTLQKTLPELKKAPSSTIDVTQRYPSSRKTLLWRIAAGVLTVMLVVVVWSPWSTNRSPQNGVTRFTINLGHGEVLVGPGSAVALSPDGTRLVYAAARSDTSRLYLRPMDGFESRQIPGTEGGTSPFFSPDGNWVGFFADGKLKKVALMGGAPQNICTANFGGGGSWAKDDTIVFGDWPNVGLWRVPATGGTPEALTIQEKHFDERELEHVWPEILPDGNTILFTGWLGANRRVALFSQATGERRTIIKEASFARYVPTGHLLFARPGELLAVPFDLDLLEVTGTAIPVLEGIGTQLRTSGSAHFSLSESGALAYVPGSEVLRQRTLVWTDRQGKVESTMLPSLVDPGGLRLSPNGNRLLVTGRQERVNLWIYDLKRGALRRFTDEEGDDGWPIWTPDGKHVLFTSNRYGGAGYNLYWKPVDGSGPEERLAVSDYHQQPHSVSPDGEVLAFSEGSHPDTGMDIWMLPLAGDREPQPFIRTQYNEFHPSFSPDGQWLAYTSDESGRREVYVKPYPGPGGVTQVSIDGGSGPVWVENGRILIYRDPGGTKVFSVSFQAGPTPRAGKPNLLFEGKFRRDFPYGRTYDVTPDGQRFLMIEESEPQSTATQINVVLNWFEELKRLTTSSE